MKEKGVENRRLQRLHCARSSQKHEKVLIASSAVHCSISIASGLKKDRISTCPEWRALNRLICSRGLSILWNERESLVGNASEIDLIRSPG